MATTPLFACQYAQLHSVSNQGRKMMSQGPLMVEQQGDMQLLRIGDPQTGQQVTWQLTREMPTLKVGSCTFMFAVPDADHFFALDFMPETDSKVIADLERVLQASTSYAVSSDTEEHAAIHGEVNVTSEATGQDFKTSPDLAQKILNAGSAAAKGIDKVGQLVGDGIVRAGLWFRKNTKESAKDVEVSPATLKRIETAKKKSEGVASAAATAASVVGNAVSYAAGVASNAVRATGVTDKEKNPKTGGAASVGKATIVALLDVFDSMHDAGKLAVARGVDETSLCMEYRYGEQAGEATLRTADIANDMYSVYGSYRKVRTRAILKAFAKDSIVSKPEGGAPAAGVTGVEAPILNMKLEDEQAAGNLHAYAPATGATPPVTAGKSQADELKPGYL